MGTQAEIRSVRRLLAQFIGKKIIEIPVGSCHKSFFDRESPAVLGETLTFNERNRETETRHSLKVEYV